MKKIITVAMRSGAKFEIEARDGMVSPIDDSGEMFIKFYSNGEYISIRADSIDSYGLKSVKE